MKKLAILADDPTIRIVLYSSLGCLFLTAVRPLSFVNFVKWTPQSVMSYLGTRLVSYSSILERKNTATALRIVRLFTRWTRKPCRKIRIFVLRSLRNKSTQAQKHSLNITDVLLKVYSRFSQVSPSKSSVHLHENESRPVIVHVPPFLHGCDLQGLTEETKHYDWQRSSPLWLAN